MVHLMEFYQQVLSIWLVAILQTSHVHSCLITAQLLGFHSQSLVLSFQQHCRTTAPLAFVQSDKQLLLDGQTSP